MNRLTFPLSEASLINGDKRLLQGAGMHGRVPSPRAFAAGS